MSILSFLYKNTNFRRAHPLSPMSCVLSWLTAVGPCSCCRSPVPCSCSCCRSPVYDPAIELQGLLNWTRIGKAVTMFNKLSIEGHREKPDILTAHVL